MQLMKHVENITRGYNPNRATMALYLDIKQAFDKIQLVQWSRLSTGTTRNSSQVIQSVPYGILG